MQSYHRINGQILELTDLASSHVEGVGFVQSRKLSPPGGDPLYPENKTGSLYVLFSGDSYYRYLDVPYSTYVDMRVAQSPGKYLHRNIKDVFDYEKADGERLDKVWCYSTDGRESWGHVCGSRDEALDELRREFAAEISEGAIEPDDASPLEGYVATCRFRKAGDYVGRSFVANLLETLGERAADEVDDYGYNWSADMLEAARTYVYAGFQVKRDPGCNLEETLERRGEDLDVVAEALGAALNWWTLRRNVEPDFYIVGDGEKVEVGLEELLEFVEDPVADELRQFLEKGVLSMKGDITDHGRSTDNDGGSANG